MAGYSSTSTNRHTFRKIRKDNRTLYQIDDRIVEISELIDSKLKIPMNFKLRGEFSSKEKKLVEAPNF